MRVFIILLLVVLSGILSAQKSANNTALVNAVATFNTSNPSTDYTNLIKELERIEVVNTKDWLPSYYLSLIYTRISISSTKNGEVYADKAMYWAQKSIENNSNDETYCIYAMAHIAKMAINPFMRYVKYKSLIDDNLNKAKKINPSNPRPYLLEAKLQMNLPRLFGGGCKQAKSLIIKAQQLLNSQTPQLVLPTWGKQSLSELIEGCPI